MLLCGVLNLVVKLYIRGMIYRVLMAGFDVGFSDIGQCGIYTESQQYFHSSYPIVDIFVRSWLRNYRVGTSHSRRKRCWRCSDEISTSRGDPMLMRFTILVQMTAIREFLIRTLVAKSRWTRRTWNEILLVLGQKLPGSLKLEISLNHPRSLLV